MQDWWTYRLSDFLLFSPRTYYRMFELYHRSIWPAQVAALASLAAILLLMKREEAWARRGIAGVLAAWWLWVGITFHLDRYAQINWSAKYFAGLFAIQGLLLAWYGIVRARVQLRVARGVGDRVAVGLLVVAVLLEPIASRLAGRTWQQVELVGVTPDPTAIATIALLALAVPRSPWWLFVVPVIWCAIGGATLWALGSAEAWIVLLSGLAGLVLAMRHRA